MTDQDVRFAFGRNWADYLSTVDEQRIDAAIADLRRLVGGSLQGRTFLDIGSGSGIHSLAAIRLGAASVVSFDYDANSVECTRTLWEREGRPENWDVRQGSALDSAFLDALPRFDVVYSWGVLHHTGSMWEAIEKTAKRTRAGGLYIIGLYFKKPVLTSVMTHVKRAYSSGGPVRRGLLLGSYAFVGLAYQAARGQLSVRTFREYRQRRGMSWWHDLVDWVGGYPFEAATPEEARAFVEPLGFEMLSAGDATSFASVNTFVFRAKR